MNSENGNGRTDEYWMGVRDALRMVDSFHKWSRRNPGRAKDLEDFIHDGLIAAAKRCESCLRDEMGISFVDEDKEEETTFEESTETDEEPEVPETEPSFEEPTVHAESDSVASKPEDSDESSISLDSVERREDETMEDLSIEGPPREFSTDFELIEPTPLEIEEKSVPEEPAVIEPESEPEEVLIEEPEPIFESEPEEVVSEPTVTEEIETDSEEEPEELPDKPSFTWSEYEEAVSPSSEPLDSEVDILKMKKRTKK